MEAFVVVNGPRRLDEQKKFVFSVLAEQTVLSPDGILIICVHSDTGDTSAVYADLVDGYR